MAKKLAYVNKNRCVACGACTIECPKEALEVNKGCYAVVCRDLCVGCGKCEKVCPAGCIEIKEREQNEK